MYIPIFIYIFIFILKIKGHITYWMYNTHQNVFFIYLKIYIKKGFSHLKKVCIDTNLTLSKYDKKEIIWKNGLQVTYKF